jgi:hypothetical protein
MNIRDIQSTLDHIKTFSPRHGDLTFDDLANALWASGCYDLIDLENALVESQADRTEEQNGWLISAENYAIEAGMLPDDES